MIRGVSTCFFLIQVKSRLFSLDGSKLNIVSLYFITTYFS